MTADSNLKLVAMSNMQPKAVWTQGVQRLYRLPLRVPDNLPWGGFRVCSRENDSGVQDSPESPGRSQGGPRRVFLTVVVEMRSKPSRKALLQGRI